MSSKPTVEPAARPSGRRRLLIEPGLQLRSLVPLLVFLLLFALMMSVLLYRLHDSAESEPDLGVQAILQDRLVTIHLHLWPILLASGLMAAYVGLRWSARVAGPVSQLHRALAELVERGETKPLPLRPGDELHVFQEDVAQLNEKMRLMASRNRDILFAVYGQVRRLGERVAGGEVIPRADVEDFVQATRAQLEKAPEISRSVRR